MRPFPISVDFRDSQAEPGTAQSPYELRASLPKNLGVKASFLGVGVDRLDYTKGIIERFRGIERFLERWPAYRGQFAFVQIGQFEHYELVTNEDGSPVELGRGGMGITYKAVDVNLGCFVTLKVINARYLDQQSVRLRFLREARAAARLRHPNVA